MFNSLIFRVTKSTFPQQFFSTIDNLLTEFTFFQLNGMKLKLHPRIRLDRYWLKVSQLRSQGCKWKQFLVCQLHTRYVSGWWCYLLSLFVKPNDWFMFHLYIIAGSWDMKIYITNKELLRPWARRQNLKFEGHMRWKVLFTFNTFPVLDLGG